MSRKMAFILGLILGVLITYFTYDYFFMEAIPQTIPQ